eukprot:Rmarinus@m.8372
MHFRRAYWSCHVASKVSQVELKFTGSNVRCLNGTVPKGVMVVAYEHTKSGPRVDSKRRKERNADVEGGWREIGRTECVMFNNSPGFVKSVSLKFNDIRRQDIRLSVYHVEDKYGGDVLRASDLIGHAYTTLRAPTIAPSNRLILPITRLEMSERKLDALFVASPEGQALAIERENPEPRVQEDDMKPNLMLSALGQGGPSKQTSQPPSASSVDPALGADDIPTVDVPPSPLVEAPTVGTGEGTGTKSGKGEVDGDRRDEAGPQGGKVSLGVPEEDAQPSLAGSTDASDRDGDRDRDGITSATVSRTASVMDNSGERRPSLSFHPSGTGDLVAIVKKPRKKRVIDGAALYAATTGPSPLGYICVFCELNERIGDSKYSSIQFKYEVPLGGWKLHPPGLKDVEMTNRQKVRRHIQSGVWILISRLHTDGTTFLPVALSEASHIPPPSTRPTNNVVYPFQNIVLPVQTLCGYQWDRTLRIELYEAKRVARRDRSDRAGPLRRSIDIPTVALVGWVDTTLNQLLNVSEGRGTPFIFRRREESPYPAQTSCSDKSDDDEGSEPKTDRSRSPHQHTTGGRPRSRRSKGKRSGATHSPARSRSVSRSPSRSPQRRRKVNKHARRRDGDGVTPAASSEAIPGSGGEEGDEDASMDGHSRQERLKDESQVFGLKELDNDDILGLLHVATCSVKDKDKIRMDVELPPFCAMLQQDKKLLQSMRPHVETDLRLVSRLNEDMRFIEDRIRYWSERVESGFSWDAETVDVLKAEKEEMKKRPSAAPSVASKVTRRGGELESEEFERTPNLSHHIPALTRTKKENIDVSLLKQLEHQRAAAANGQDGIVAHLGTRSSFSAQQSHRPDPRNDETALALHKDGSFDWSSMADRTRTNRERHAAMKNAAAWGQVSIELSEPDNVLEELTQTMSPVRPTSSMASLGILNANSSSLANVSASALSMASRATTAPTRRSDYKRSHTGGGGNNRSVTSFRTLIREGYRVLAQSNRITAESRSQPGAMPSSLFARADADRPRGAGAAWLSALPRRGGHGASGSSGLADWSGMSELVQGGSEGLVSWDGEGADSPYRPATSPSKERLDDGHRVDIRPHTSAAGGSASWWGEPQQHLGASRPGSRGVGGLPGTGRGRPGSRLRPKSQSQLDQGAQAHSSHSLADTHKRRSSYAGPESGVLDHDGGSGRSSPDEDDDAMINVFYVGEGGKLIYNKGPPKVVSKEKLLDEEAEKAVRTAKKAHGVSRSRHHHGEFRPRTAPAGSFHPDVLKQQRLARRRAGKPGRKLPKVPADEELPSARALQACGMEYSYYWDD